MSDASGLKSIFQTSMLFDTIEEVLIIGACENRDHPCHCFCTPLGRYTVYLAQQKEPLHPSAVKSLQTARIRCTVSAAFAPTLMPKKENIKLQLSRSVRPKPTQTIIAQSAATITTQEDSRDCMITASLRMYFSSDTQPIVHKCLQLFRVLFTLQRNYLSPANSWNFRWKAWNSFFHQRVETEGAAGVVLTRLYTQRETTRLSSQRFINLQTALRSWIIHPIRIKVCSLTAPLLVHNHHTKCWDSLQLFHLF